jgi:hypothetical protein
MSTFGFRYMAGSPDIRDFPEDETSGSFKAGDLVDLSSGEVILHTGTTSVWGVTLKDASGTTSTAIPVHVIHSDQVWLAEIDTTIAASNVGLHYDLNITTAGSMSVDLGSTTQAMVTIEALDPRSTTRAFIRFHQSVVDSEGE